MKKIIGVQILGSTLYRIYVITYIFFQLLFSTFQVAHGLRTPNEGINQRNLKIWADVADKICYGRT